MPPSTGQASAWRLAIYRMYDDYKQYERIKSVQVQHKNIK